MYNKLDICCAVNARAVTCRSEGPDMPTGCDLKSVDHGRGTLILQPKSADGTQDHMAQTCIPHCPETISLASWALNLALVVMDLVSNGSL